MTMGSLRQMLRFVSPEECQSLQDICEYNDISEEQLVSAPEKIYSIEMFMYNLPKICCMSFFPNLVSLSLIQQGISCIEGLYCCQSLEVLRLSENKIQRIEGLQNCLKLKELYLHSNRITHIKNLSHLSALQVLWLANNEISWVEGLEALVMLKELSLARNPIGELGEILEIKSLECLNVAATNIGSFKEIGSLTRLKNLKELRFSDPHWGDSPLSLLHNYQTYVLFRLRHLHKLDTLDLTEEAKQAAKAIYTRKRVYYNMCIKSLQHSRNNAVTNVVKGESKRIKSIQKTLTKLIKTLKDIEKEIYEAIKAEQLSKGAKRKDLVSKGEWWEEAFVKVATVDEQIQNLMGKLDYLVEEMQMAKAKEQSAVDLSIHWLMLELDTGGNIRMEVGKPKDPWYKSCEELVLSRFFHSDFAPYGIVGVSVVKVTRVHNRFLQDRFAQRLETMRPTKRTTEHLLFGESLQAPDEIQWIIEEGFPFLPDNMSSRASETAVSLSNSIGLADLHRLKALPKQFKQTTFWKTRATGFLLVVKACLGTSIQDLNDSATVKKAAFPSADSVYRLHPKDPKQRSWFVFDPILLLPEYLVELKYKFSNDGRKSPSQLSSTETDLEGLLLSERGRGLEILSERSRSDTESVNLLEKQAYDSLLTIRQVGRAEFSTWVVETCATLSRDDKGILLRDEYFIRRKHAKDLSKITHLNLHNGNIMGIEHLRSLTGLRVLVLSFNKISKIQGLDELQSLEKLDLSFNMLKRIEGLSGQRNLQVLDLTGNEIWNLDDLALLHGQVPRLVNLNLRCNPLVEELGYRTVVLRAVPSLTTLDCICVTPEDRAEGSTKSNSSPELLVCSTLSQWSILPPSPSCPLQTDEKGCKSDEVKGTVGVKGTAENACRRQSQVRLNPYTKLLRLDILNPFTKLLKGVQSHTSSLKEDRIWCEGVEEVHLEHRRLRTMHCFDRLPNLRRLFLSGNEISIIEGLENCSMLEELILEDNRIKQVKGLSQLQGLWKLDLGRNQLTSCAGIGSCVALTQLSIEENNISSLEGLGTLSCLMELYAANNQLSDFRELFHIRDLPKLMVLDLAGNLVCQTHDYRTYTIFSLRKLKVLDGRNVDNSELAEARNKYLGRLTRDVLEECVGHNHFSNMKKMDLSSQSLRHCGDVFQMKELQGLIELNLNNNLFTSLQAVRYLKNLVVLRVENNKLENGPLVELSVPSIAANNGTLRRSANSPMPCVVPGMEVEVLELGGNNISSISSLCLAQTFHKLKLLSLQYNRIVKVDGLEGMAKLEKLLIGHNSIKELDPDSLTGLVSLKSLHMGDNTLRTLAHIGNLPSLQVLDVSSNFLTSNRFGCLSSIDNLAFLPGLVEVTLTNNPMTRQHLYRTAVISKLTQLNVLDCKEITQEERLEAEQFLAGKEGTANVGELNGILEHQPSNGHGGIHGGQGKVPLKVTSLDFEAMCTQILPPSPQNSGFLTGAKGLHVGSTVAQNSQIGPPKLWEPGDVKHASNHLIQSYFRNRLRGDQKVIVLPLDVLMIRNSNAKAMYETCAKQQP